MRCARKASREVGYEYFWASAGVTSALALGSAALAPLSVTLVVSAGLVCPKRSAPAPALTLEAAAGEEAVVDANEVVGVDEVSIAAGEGVGVGAVEVAGAAANAFVEVDADTGLLEDSAARAISAKACRILCFSADGSKPFVVNSGSTKAISIPRGSNAKQRPRHELPIYE
jgi:hypothetical protein